MIEEKHICCEAGVNSSPIITRIQFGHGDSSHETYVICEKCGRKGEAFHNYGFFENSDLRKAQESWDLKKDLSNGTI